MLAAIKHAVDDISSFSRTLHRWIGPIIRATHSDCYRPAYTASNP